MNYLEIRILAYLGPTNYSAGPNRNWVNKLYSILYDRFDWGEDGYLVREQARLYYPSKYFGPSK